MAQERLDYTSYARLSSVGQYLRQVRDEWVVSAILCVVERVLKQCLQGILHSDVDPDHCTAGCHAARNFALPGVPRSKGLAQVLL